MYQRITNNYINENVLNNLFTNRTTLIDLQRQIASGTKFERPSEDVLSAITVLSSNSTLGKIENYIKNIETAKLEIETADRALLTSLDSVHEARELTIQALNATSGTEELNMMAEQIEQIIQQIKDLGNTKYGTTYIFGGKETNSAPYTDPPTTVDDGEGIYYGGSASGSHEREIEIAEGVTITVNLCGEDIFGQYYKWDHDADDDPTDLQAVGDGLIATLSKIKEQMESSTPDKDIIRQEMATLDNDLQTLLTSQATLGSLLARLDITERLHKDDKISVTDIKSGAQDIDYAKAISDLKFQEAALQASLQVGAQIIKPSLLNYL
ncbi:MAG: flagellar hook-associated protein 3 [Candidatus Melainabacteria bacterium GWF2_37_15]|nr:MAG: flagellar hook-associated protein 3 [Candidatus Melainabacteria bacterium GWF2_37_15]